MGNYSVRQLKQTAMIGNCTTRFVILEVTYPELASGKTCELEAQKSQVFFRMSG